MLWIIGKATYRKIIMYLLFLMCFLKYFKTNINVINERSPADQEPIGNNSIATTGIKNR